MESLTEQTSPEEEARPARVYESPMIVASFAKDELTDQLPADITPHIHAVQNS